MATNLDEQEAALYLSMMQLHTALGQMLDRKAHLEEKELVKLQAARTAALNLQHVYNNSLSLGSRIPASLMMKEPKAEPKCASCGTTEGDIEPSCWAQKGKMSLLCYLCELEAEHSFYDAEAREVLNEGSI